METTWRPPTCRSKLLSARAGNIWFDIEDSVYLHAWESDVLTFTRPSRKRMVCTSDSQFHFYFYFHLLYFRKNSSAIATQYPQWSLCKYTFSKLFPIHSFTSTFTFISCISEKNSSAGYTIPSMESVQIHLFKIISMLGVTTGAFRKFSTLKYLYHKARITSTQGQFQVNAIKLPNVSLQIVKMFTNER